MTNITGFNAVMCRYNEIALKGANRPQFEHLFVEAIKRALRELDAIKFVQERGRILVCLENFRPFSNRELNLIKVQLPTVFGLTSFSPGFMLESTLEAIDSQLDATFPGHYEMISRGSANNSDISYRMRARRSDKSFPLTSSELEIHFAEKFLSQYPRLKVNLNKADLTIGVEVRKKWSFVYYNQFSGPGGLPSGSNGGGLALLSGGIDSPVACYMVMKRGTPLHFITFHSFPYTPPESIIKVSKLVRILNRRQKRGILYACNLVAAQKCVRDNCTEKFRTILYRRIMVRIATGLAKSINLEALVTGESIGQVASQTVRNMDTINRATDMLIMRPLVGMDKQEVTNIADKIGTLSISQENCPDSCTVFAPKSPTTAAKLDRILEEEQRIDSPALVEACLSAIKQIDLNTYKEYEFTASVPHK